MGLSDPRTLIHRDLADMLSQIDQGKFGMTSPEPRMGIRVNQTIRIAS
jgi:hypothetical protein